MVENGWNGVFLVGFVEYFGYEGFNFWIMCKISVNEVGSFFLWDV